jgi:hypothetical protein
VETFNALGGPSRVSRRAQMQAVSVPRQITKRKIQSVDFVQGLRVKRSPYGSLRERLRVRWRYRRGKSF